MLRRIGIIVALLAVTVGFSFLIYTLIFTGSGETTDDLKFTHIESGVWDRDKVEAECEIESDNQFCFKDTIWAEQQNMIEFDGYLVVEYTNTADVIEEISITTIRLENVTPGYLIIRDTTPAEIFIDPGQSTQVRYDYAFDVANEGAYENVKASGLELQTSFTNTVGQKASEVFTVEYQN